jgi:hypothetical protein
MYFGTGALEAIACRFYFRAESLDLSLREWPVTAESWVTGMGRLANSTVQSEAAGDNGYVGERNFIAAGSEAKSRPAQIEPVYLG